MHGLGQHSTTTPACSDNVGNSYYSYLENCFKSDDQMAYTKLIETEIPRRVSPVMEDSRPILIDLFNPNTQ